MSALPVCVPPDPHPKKPRFAVPAHACDSHAHVFGPKERYPLNPKRGYDPAPAGAAEHRRMLDALGLERGVIVQPSVYGTDNRALLDAIAADPERLRGVAGVGADVTDAELERLDRAGVRGIRVNL